MVILPREKAAGAVRVREEKENEEVEVESAPGVCDLFFGSWIFGDSGRGPSEASSFCNGIVCLSLFGTKIVWEVEFSGGVCRRDFWGSTWWCHGQCDTVWNLLTNASLCGGDGGGELAFSEAGGYW